MEKNFLDQVEEDIYKLLVQAEKDIYKLLVQAEKDTAEGIKQLYQDIAKWSSKIDKKCSEKGDQVVFIIKELISKEK